MATTERDRVEQVLCQKLHEAQQACEFAFAQTRKIYAELPYLPARDGNLALAKALEYQNYASDKYARVLKTFTRLILYGKLPKECF